VGDSDLFDGPFAAVYSFYMEHETAGRAVARIVWGSDIEPYYRGLREIEQASDRTAVIDAPCGSGIVLKHVPPGRRLRYTGVDLSAGMLRRAARTRDERRLEGVELVEGDAAAIPLPDGSADLFLSWWGLHCFDGPADAVAEAARCLRPGGRLLGATFVRGRRRLDRLRVRPHKGAFGAVGSEEEVRGWLRDAGFAEPELDVRGVFAYFDVRKPG
jgi:SAM-dependent methyltransferase